MGTWLAITSRPSNPPPGSAPPPALESAIDPVTPIPHPAGVAESLKPLAKTSSPARFAEAVAHALFDWDTTWPAPVSDYTGRLLAVADPTGEESPGLVADIASYLPTTGSWVFLKQYYTRQWLEVSSVTVPELWTQALAEAGPGSLAPGTTAYTIRAVRHRAGVWEDEPVSSAHDVAFTIFMVCEPSYPACHLLRLSRLDEPLD
ncbi:hypothetical protein FB382_001505 [Nocardioides ginsengisegetis]|uniref:Uncharacterized protein n=1 Tax=Nocardioides ginsengisegetis TaxID=661491 RepID=A0A7W3IZ97_9ACTN|nr:cell wall protein [Nocardioides ginsengisegetis]MBA8803214.1 hypothetical protein [Nocardioides ginsengisegetis]